MQDAPPIDVGAAEWKSLLGVLQARVPDREVWAFGSRAKWKAKEFSDLDLAIDGKTPIPLSVLADLSDDFDEFEFRFRVDVVDLLTVSPEFRRRIEQDRVLIQRASEVTFVHLGSVCSKIGSGATPRGGKEVYLDHGPVSLIRSQNIYNDGFREDGLAFIDYAQAEKLANVEVLENDVLLNITGDSVARCCMAPSKFLPARVNQHVAIIRTDPARLNPRFLRFFLVSELQQDRMLALASSGATRNALTKEMIQSFLVPTPPIHEQNAVATLLTNIENRIETLYASNAVLEAIARAIFKSWFVDSDPVKAKAEGREPEGMDADTAALFPSEFEETPLGPVPCGWNVVNLGQLAEFAYGKPLKAENRNGGRFPVMGSNGRVGWHDEALVLGPGIVVGRKGNPGTVTWVDSDFFPIDTTFFVRPRNLARGLYILKNQLDFLNLPDLSADSAVPGLNREIAYQTRLANPPKLIANIFQDIVDPLVAKAAQNEGLVAILADLRDTLLPRLISGKLRVQEAEAMLTAV
jgi:type I restriction enzyme S subunit